MEARMRSHLNGNDTGQFKVVDFLLESADHIGKIICFLSIFRITAFFGSSFHFGEFFVAELFGFNLTCNDIHGKLFLILLVAFVHLIKHCSILHQDDLMLLKLLNDLIYVNFRLIILCLKTGKAVLGLFKQTFKSLLIFLIEIESFQFNNQIREDAADFSKILSPNRLESRLRKLCNVLLCRCTIIEDLFRVENIDFICKFTNRCLLLLA